jgi:DNA ligase 1
MKMLSEKLDGVWASKQGARLVTRTGRAIHAPAWFVEGIPSGACGEIWGGRGTFQKTAALVRTVRSNPDQWSGIRFMIFPNCRAVAESAQKLPEHVAIIGEIESHGKHHAALYMRDIVASGGEGAMLRDTETGEIDKLVPFATSEAEVVAEKQGGSISCVWRGVAFRMAVRKDSDPKRGELVTFSFIGRTDAGKPRHARFIDVRNYE